MPQFPVAAVGLAVREIFEDEACHHEGGDAKKDEDGRHGGHRVARLLYLWRMRTARSHEASVGMISCRVETFFTAFATEDVSEG